MDPKFPMRNTTLCYLEQDDAYLMLHRVTKKNDLNHDKWIGVGGKFEPFESPEDCLLREVREETGLQLTRFRCRGIVTFILGRLTERRRVEIVAEPPAVKKAAVVIEPVDGAAVRALRAVGVLVEDVPHSGIALVPPAYGGCDPAAAERAYAQKNRQPQVDRNQITGGYRFATGGHLLRRQRHARFCGAEAGQRCKD